MFYIRPDGTWPAFYGEIQEIISGWVPGDTLPDGWVEVVESTPPHELAFDEDIQELEPQLVNGVMTQQWGIRKLTEEELERKNAPTVLREKLTALGLTEYELFLLSQGKF